MSDGQSRAETIRRGAIYAGDVSYGGGGGSGGQVFIRPPAVPSATQPAAKIPSLVALGAAEERQRARDHELAMARVENEAALVEARVRLAAAWLPGAVGVTVAAAAAGGALLGALFSWAVLR